MVLLFVSQNSFLHGFNPYPDAGLFVTIGRSIRAGAVPYLDVYDHKGPIFLLLTTIIYYNRVTAFVYDFVTIGLIVHFMYKTISLTGDKDTAVAKTILIFSFLILIWSEQGSPEQSIVAIMMYGVYAVMAKKNTVCDWAIYGILIAYVFYTKINLVLFFVPVFLYLLHETIIEKSHLALKLSASFGTFAIASIAIVLYFLSKHALTAYVDGYFLDNSKYGTWSDVSNVTVLLCLGIPLGAIFCMFFSVMIGNKANRTPGLIAALACMCGITAEFIFPGRFYFYYFLVYIPVLAVMFMRKGNKQTHTRVLMAFTALIITFSVLFSIDRSRTILKK